MGTDASGQGKGKIFVHNPEESIWHSEVSYRSSKFLPSTWQLLNCAVWNKMNLVVVAQGRVTWGFCDPAFTKSQCLPGG